MKQYVVVIGVADYDAVNDRDISGTLADSVLGDGHKCVSSNTASEHGLSFDLYCHG